jgi:hypothetical protein
VRSSPIPIRPPDGVKMDQCNYLLVADANFYRGISDSDLHELKALEKQAAIMPVVSFVIASELLAHLADPNSASYSSCRAAIRRLYLHCVSESPESALERMVPNPQDLIALRLFPGAQRVDSDLVASYLEMISNVAAGGEGGIDASLHERLSSVREYRDRIEKRFGSMLKRIRRQVGKNPGSALDFDESQRPSPKDFVRKGYLLSAAAGGIALITASDYGITLTDDQAMRLGARLINDIPTTLEVFVSAVAKVILDGGSPERAVNSVWDMYFALVASPYLCFSGTPVLVVTRDRAIGAAAATTGTSSRVLSLEGYRAFLQDWEA